MNGSSQRIRVEGLPETSKDFLVSTQTMFFTETDRLIGSKNPRGSHIHTYVGEVIYSGFIASMAANGDPSRLQMMGLRPRPAILKPR